jgi:hypothetical protein
MEAAIANLLEPGEKILVGNKVWGGGGRGGRTGWEQLRAEVAGTRVEGDSRGLQTWRARA